MPLNPNDIEEGKYYTDNQGRLLRVTKVRRYATETTEIVGTKRSKIKTRMSEVSWEFVGIHGKLGRGIKKGTHKMPDFLQGIKSKAKPPKQ